jgi:AhpD family alkylhydroperoxidase
MESARMENDWKTANRELGQAIGLYRKAAPETAQAFSGLAAAATKDGPVSPKTKELMAVAIGIALRCQGCVGFHTQAAIRLGATREEIIETINLAVYMGGGPSYVYGAEALKAFDQLSGGG